MAGRSTQPLAVFKKSVPELIFEDLLAPIDDLGEGDALESWRWLVGPGSRPLLMTALGDVFVLMASGEVCFIDTYEGTLKPAGTSYDDWKQRLKDQQNIIAWFSPGLVEAMRERGVFLSHGQCYSPIVPPVVGGDMLPENMEASLWRVHFYPSGQIHEQILKLPEGTPIEGFKIKWK